MNKSQLLCTFSNKSDYESALIKINNLYSVLFNKIYILENEDDPYRLYLTYNVEFGKRSEYLEKTISMHRKKHTNTLYTINALNELIKEKTGVYDDSYEVNWEDYYNMIILTSDAGIKLIPTRIFKIIDL